MFNKVIFSTFLCGVLAQSFTGDSCISPDQNSGTCTFLNDCPYLLHLLMTQNRNNTIRTYLRNSVCQLNGQNPIVCCPQQTQQENKPAENDVTLPESPNCGFSNISTGRIVNGVPAKLGEFPWLAALGYRNTRNSQQPKWLCGGSLITNRHILTAAHCAYNRQDLYLVRLGDLDLFSETEGADPRNYLISKVTLHEKFNPRKFSYDIAILTLEETVTQPTVWPICLPTSEPYISKDFLNTNPMLAGWGSISFNGPQSSALQQISVPVLGNSQCERQFGKVATIDANILCAGSLNGDKDACGGDSGGPLMHVVTEGKHYRTYQIGVVSYGFRCAEPGYPGVYTRLTAFISWIRQNL